MVNEHPVLANERNEVRDGRESNQVQVRDKRLRIDIERTGDQLTQLVRNSGAAQALVRIRAVGTLWIHHRHRLRE